LQGGVWVRDKKNRADGIKEKGGTTQATKNTCGKRKY